MQRFTITKNATSQIIPVSIYDSSSTTGAKLAGLVFNTAGLTAYYNRMGAAGAAIAGTLSTTQMTTDLAEATNDHYNGRIIIWTTGVLAGQATDITAYSGTSKMLTYTAVTEAPTAADTFVIV